ncbi:Trans-2,3-dihydro-3-hydroxyanthranilate isomerase [Pseudovibrio axinellae]|uniref:Trans-2,3-dihydro-3-hydroxyanthranilate isomerase n=1 Tax=Pseudovibrio axinellae TaxID=989403 RepID=A0A161V8X0_9HYPH|nr:PhzF family phenazine biosynthesis protein [Pseudovibrio axinellae]KZL21439.1 Trans-2,3-dihydro-3-hydroxyanthranilate isomerase [Pseudovibrio axinellae]SER05346.1 trans-2,3-dihydro-3-hydroxyanthranilate isomerase [Pseudovibrio axinellae]
MARSYALLDVFTDKALAGNPLAVVLDATGLSASLMQQIACEFNLSETVFVFPAQNPAHNAAVRIFTPSMELPFAGHPTIGTAVLLAENRFGAPDNDMDALILLEEKVGLLRCAVSLQSGKATAAEFDVPKLPKPAHKLGEKEVIAAALSLEPNEISFENHRPKAWDAGLPFAFVPVADMDAINRIQLVEKYWEEAFGSIEHNNTFAYCRQTHHANSAFHARMVYLENGLAREDPATGSAVAAFAGSIVEFDQPLDGTHKYVIEQGFKMGRPSFISLEIEMQSGKIHVHRIGGQAVILARGELLI